jgi:hypothetical protein
MDIPETGKFNLAQADADAVLDYHNRMSTQPNFIHHTEDRIRTCTKSPSYMMFPCPKTDPSLDHGMLHIVHFRKTTHLDEVNMG